MTAPVPAPMPAPCWVGEQPASDTAASKRPTDENTLNFFIALSDATLIGHRSFNRSIRAVGFDYSVAEDCLWSAQNPETKRWVQISAHADRESGQKPMLSRSAGSSGGRSGLEIYGIDPIAHSQFRRRGSRSVYCCIGLDAAERGIREAEIFGAMMCAGFGFPESPTPLWSAIVGKDGWTCFFVELRRSLSDRTAVPASAFTWHANSLLDPSPIPPYWTLWSTTSS
jgi:hypothetical protein